MLHHLICLTSLLAAGPAVERTREPVPADGPAITVRGIIQTPEGAPIAGATVVLRAQVFAGQYSGGVRHNRDMLARAATDQEGRFEFDKIAIPPRMEEQIDQLQRGNGGAELIAWADTRALNWIEVKRLRSDDPVTLVLAPHAEVNGIIHDSQGRAISGVDIQLTGVSPATDELDSFFRGPGDLNLITSEVWPHAVSGDDGRFALEHMPRNQRLTMRFDHPGHEGTYVVVDTGPDNGSKEIHFRNAGRDTRPLLRTPLSMTLEARRFAVVKVTSHDGKPVASGAVQVADSERRFAGWVVVDQSGEARIAIAKAGKYTLSYAADPLQPLLGTVVSADIPADESTPTIEMRLAEPRWLTGRVVDADTGKGIVGAYVANGVSGDDGSFRLPVAPGKARLSFRHKVHGYFPPTWFNEVDRSKEPPGMTIEVPAAAQLEPVTIHLARGLVIRGTVRDKEGKAVPGIGVQGQNDDAPYRRASAITDAQGRYELGALSPHVKSLVTVAGSAGAFYSIIDGQGDYPWDKTRFVELEIKLDPGVALAGRVTVGGKPRAGVRMRLHRTLGEVKNRYYEAGETVTDNDGKYRVSGLATGDQYYFEIVDPDGMSAPGWPHQSPYIQAVGEGKAVIELPDAQLVSRGQRLRGVVVDPKGKPVAGVTVSASLVGGHGSLSNTGDGPAPWTDTDKQGRFELSRLPDQPIELMAYRANAMGGRILYPAKIRPKLNQLDIHIILDPTLSDEVEDLDAAPDKDKPNQPSGRPR